MFCKNEEVNAVNISDGLGVFLNVQSKFQTKVILVGHLQEINNAIYNLLSGKVRNSIRVTKS